MAKKKLSSYQKLKKKIRKQKKKKKLRKKEEHIYILLMEPDSPEAERLRLLYETKFSLADTIWQGSRDEEIQNMQGIFPLMQEGVKSTDKTLTQSDIYIHLQKNNEEE